MVTEALDARPHRPNLMGTRHVVSAGHYLGAEAGFLVLEAGGNAVDAGVAAGITLNVVEPHMCCFGGVAPTIVHLAATGEIITVDGLGTWPRAASCDFFQRHHPGPVPEGILQTVVPAAPDAWLTLLERYGTISFGDAAEAAIRFARDGFPVYPQITASIKERIGDFQAQAESAEIFLPKGRPPEPGEMFVQSDLAGTLQFLVDEERRAAVRGREAGLQAVRNAFYAGDIAAAIAKFQRENGGLLAFDDLAGYRVTVAPSVSTRFRDIDVHGCGPWCQGPMLLQQLSLLNEIDLGALGHNTTAYVHTVTEAIKLAAADREAYYGDPKFVEVPMEALLSRAYAEERRKMIRPDAAWPEMPPAGDAGGGARPYRSSIAPLAGAGGTMAADTTYVCVVDEAGNAFSCTPSDGVMRKSPVVPGTGLYPSGRGNQSRTDPRHPSSIEPGKRPRLTPNPALAIRPGKELMPFGSPGGDQQTQVMLQVFLNMHVFAMDPQSAVEAPRFGSVSFPDSFSPHEYRPGVLELEESISRSVATELAALGHTIEWRPGADWPQTGVCAVRLDTRTGLLCGAADRRRMSYAVGW